MLGGGPLGTSALGGALPTVAPAAAATSGPGPLGRWALGQLPDAGAVAAGAALGLDLAFVPGAASGESQITVVIGGAAPRRQDAVAPGAYLELFVSLRPGRPGIDAAARGAVLPLTVARLAGGAATGEATGYDNEFLLLLAA
jgi:hypothetical protein